MTQYIAVIIILSIPMIMWAWKSDNKKNAEEKAKKMKSHSDIKNMDLEYICNDCSLEMTSEEYEEQDATFCPACSGNLEENTEKIWCFSDMGGQLKGPLHHSDLRKAFLNKEIHEETDIFKLGTSESKPLKNWDSLKHVVKVVPPAPDGLDAISSEGNVENTFLVTCESCSKHFSKRAEACPKCGWKPQLMCQICQQKIPFDSGVCPECGDPNPFEKLNNAGQLCGSAKGEKVNNNKICLNGKIPVLFRTPLVYLFLLFGAPIGRKIGWSMNPSTLDQSGVYVGISVMISTLCFGAIGYGVSVGIDFVTSNKVGRVLIKSAAGAVGVLAYCAILASI